MSPGIGWPVVQLTFRTNEINELAKKSSTYSSLVYNMTVQLAVNTLERLLTSFGF